MTGSSPSMHSKPQLTVVVPMHNEADNVRPLIGEIVAALRGHVDFEIVCIDDCSKDATLTELRAIAPATPELRVIRHGTQSGQSTALRNGVKAARGDWIATLDGDGQNDPTDIPRLLAERDAGPASVRLYAGWRATRRDTWVKRLSSRIANGVRRAMLRDDCPDTGCGLKLFDRAVFLDAPYFDHMHRYLPALFKRAGHDVRNVRVGHRPRLRGKSKYGIANRLWVGIVDLFGVAWLMRRARLTAVDEIFDDSGSGQ